MKNILFFTTVMFTLSLHAEGASTVDEEMMVINSGFADYDGRKITLKDHVVVEHELGTISANEVVLMSTPGASKICFGGLQMRENVKIALKDGGELCAANADVDYQQLMGKFYGNPQREYVVYTENCSKKEPPVSLIVKARRMAIHIDKEARHSDSPKSCINLITAEENVTLNYNHDFIVAADSAVYQRMEQDLGERRSMPGHITLKAASQNGICRVTNRDGDMIKANQICIDTIKHSLVFSNPKGSVNLAEGAVKPGRIDFSAGILLWDQSSLKLTLKEHIEINQKGLGKLETQEEVCMVQEVVDGRKQLSSIESLSETLLTYADEDKNLSHTLNCHGKLLLDHKTMTAYLDSPRNSAGEVLKDKQVNYQDSRGEIFADQLEMKYGISEQSIVPENIILKGNVRVLNHLSPSNEETSAVLQYALADTVEYSPKTQEMQFKASEDSRVLFYDKANNVEVSAPALKLKRDENKKESIQGIGDVRFSFIEQEFQQLRKRFSFEKIN